MSSARIFSRGGPALPRAAKGDGAWITDATGRRYLDAAGGAIVVGIGHGRAEVAKAAAEQMGRIAYAHGSSFTADALELWAEELGPLLPMDGAALYPVSGGSEAAETALKMVRAYWLAKGEPERTIVVSRWGSYHGNTLGALDLSGRRGLRKPYEPWLGRFEHVSAAYPYRAGLDGADAIGSGAEAVAELDVILARVGPGRIAAFVAEPIVGATLAAAVPPDDYWPAVSAWCTRTGAAVARAVLAILKEERLVEASATRGVQLRAALNSALAGEPWVGEIRGRGLLIGIELVLDRATKMAHQRSARVTERVLAAAKSAEGDGLLLYSATAQANGVDGDQLVIGPPFVIGDAEIERIASGTAAAIRAVREAS